MKPSGFIERGWCQGAYAKTCEGFSVPPLNRYAVAWCILGAVHAAKLGQNEFINAMTTIAKQIGTNDIHGWNDDPSRTQHEVLIMLRGCYL